MRSVVCVWLGVHVVVRLLCSTTVSSIYASHTVAKLTARTHHYRQGTSHIARYQPETKVATIDLRGPPHDPGRRAPS